MRANLYSKPRVLRRLARDAALAVGPGLNIGNKAMTEGTVHIFLSTPLSEKNLHLRFCWGAGMAVRPISELSRP